MAYQQIKSFFSSILPKNVSSTNLITTDQNEHQNSNSEHNVPKSRGLLALATYDPEFIWHKGEFRRLEDLKKSGEIPASVWQIIHDDAYREERPEF